MEEVRRSAMLVEDAPLLMLDVRRPGTIMGPEPAVKELRVGREVTCEGET
jgi:hypothetical protein